MICKTQDELNDGLAKWVKILKLQDWSIVAELIPHWHPDANGGATLGCVNRMRKKQSAVIKILQHDHIGFPHDQSVPTDDAHDMERSLVHELIHCHMLLFEPEGDGAEWDLCERFVETMASAIVELDRKAKIGYNG